MISTINNCIPNLKKDMLSKNEVKVRKAVAYSSIGWYSATFRPEQWMLFRSVNLRCLTGSLFESTDFEKRVDVDINA